MKAISFDKIKSLAIDPLTCYEWVSDAIAHKGEAILPANTSLKPGIGGVFYNTMPVLLPTASLGIWGCKGGHAVS